MDFDADPGSNGVVFALTVSEASPTFPLLRTLPSFNTEILLPILHLNLQQQWGRFACQ